MYIDCIRFAEIIVISTSMCLFIISAKLLTNGGEKSFLKCLIIATLAISCYQATINIFIVFVLLLSILKNKDKIKKIFIDILKCVCVCIVILSINFISIKLACQIYDLSQNRVQIDVNIFIGNAIITFTNLWIVIKTTCNMIPNNYFIYAIITLMIFITVCAIIYKKQNSFIYSAYILLAFSIISAFILNVISTSSFYGARTHISLGMTIGVIFIYIYVESDILTNKNVINIFSVALLVAYVSFTIYNYERLMILEKKLNILEANEIQQIEEYIKKHEKDSEIKITKIIKVLYPGQREKQYYKELPATPFTEPITRSAEFIDRTLKLYLNRPEMESFLVTSNSVSANEYTDMKENIKGYECIKDKFYISVYSY